MKTLPFLITCSLLIGGPMGSALAQGQKSQRIPFPLPTREMRLVEEAKDPNTPIPHIAELLFTGKTPVVLAALESLGERGDDSLIPTLEKAQKVAPSDGGAFARTIREIRERQTMAGRGVPAIDMDAEIAYLQAHPISGWKEDDWDNNSVNNYVQALLELTKAGDKRILPFVEDYAIKVRPQLTELDNLLANDRSLRESDGRLGEEYWRLKLQDMTLTQKVALFKGSESANPSVYNGFEEELIREGNSVSLYMADIVQDQVVSPGLRERAARILYWINDPRTTKVFLRTLRDRTASDGLKKAMLSFLARAGHPRSVQATLRTLDEGIEGYPDNWEEVGAALSRVETLAKTDTDKELLERSILPYVQKGSLPALNAIGDVGGEKSIHVLIDLVKNPTTGSQLGLDEIKRIALTSLGAIGRRIDDGDGRIVNFLLAISSDQTSSERVHAVRALAFIGKQSLIPLLLDLARKEKDAGALSFEVSGIYLAGGEDAVKALQEVKELAQMKQNTAIVELTEEGLMRLEREKRTGKIGHVGA